MINRYISHTYDIYLSYTYDKYMSISIFIDVCLSIYLPTYVREREIEFCCEEFAHTIMKAEKSPDLPSEEPGELVL